MNREARKLPTAEVPERDTLQAEKRRTTHAYVAGALDEEEWRLRIVAIDDRLARIPGPFTGSVLFAGEKLRSLGQLWECMTTDERRDACRTLFEAIVIDTREKQLYFRPWPEFEPLFKARATYVGSLLGPPGFEPRTNRL